MTRRNGPCRTIAGRFGRTMSCWKSAALAPGPGCRFPPTLSRGLALQSVQDRQKSRGKPGSLVIARHRRIPVHPRRLISRHEEELETYGGVFRQIDGKPPSELLKAEQRLARHPAKVFGWSEYLPTKQDRLSASVIAGAGQQGSAPVRIAAAQRAKRGGIGQWAARIKGLCPIMALIRFRFWAAP